MFSIAVFGPIVNEGYVNNDSGPELRCVFNGNAGACRFGVALGLGAFLACAAFLLLDLRFQQISSVRDRRRAVLLDLGFSGGRGWAEIGRSREGNARDFSGGRGWGPEGRAGAGPEGGGPDSEGSGAGKGQRFVRRWAGPACVQTPVPSVVGPSSLVERL